MRRTIAAALIAAGSFAATPAFATECFDGTRWDKYVFTSDGETVPFSKREEGGFKIDEPVDSELKAQGVGQRKRQCDGAKVWYFSFIYASSDRYVVDVWRVEGGKPQQVTRFKAKVDGMMPAVLEAK